MTFRLQRKLPENKPMSIQRRISRKIRIGTVEVGGDAPVSIPSKTNTATRDTAATLHQINRLARRG